MKRYNIKPTSPEKYDLLSPYLGPYNSKDGWVFNNERDYLDALNSIPDNIDYVTFTTGSSNRPRLSLNDFVLYIADTEALREQLQIEDYYASLLPNSFCLITRKGVYLLLSTSDRIPSDPVFSGLRIIDRIRKRSIVSRASVSWRGKNIPKNLDVIAALTEKTLRGNENLYTSETVSVLEEYNNKRAVTIREEIRIPGTSYILEKNDKIYYGR